MQKKYGVRALGLSKRHRGVTRSQRDKYINLSALHLKQESELVKYIQDLTEQRLSPTRAMVQTYASILAKKEVSEAWVTRFLARNQEALISRWAPAIDSKQHKADSYNSYSLYFKALNGKINKYDIEPKNTYNIDEKGFAISVIRKSKRIFNK